ncbi:MAG: Uma2 family endonuclease [Chloroflexi bacterium]|nr:Uma2 family endonuclease [Chloroflexota bacterium]
MAAPTTRVAHIDLNQASSSPHTAATPEAVPSLENGDRLTRHEFERRYAAMPQVKRAELIEGIVYMSSPLKFDEHAVPHGDIITWLGFYTANTPETARADNATLRLDVENVAQPDALMRINTMAGGQSRVAPDGYLEGAPELIVEIAASSASNDLRDKFKVYRRAGVKEYAVWQVYERHFDWWVLDAGTGDYRSLVLDDQGVLRSWIFPGLWLNVPALLAGDLAGVLATLQQGVQSPEHQAFAQSLLSRTKAAGGG